MAMATVQIPQGWLSLSDDGQAPLIAAPWIGALVTLGSRAARWSRSSSEQLIIVVSVPSRDFAATLIGCGWMMAAPPPPILSLAEAMTSLTCGTQVRVVTEGSVLTDEFRGIDHDRNRLRLTSEWLLDKVRAVAPVEPCGFRKQPLPVPGAINRMVGFDEQWAARLCRPAGDLALIGVLKWLNDDITAYLGFRGEREAIAQILWPESQKAATWSTKLYAARKVDAAPPADSDLRAVVLDGAAAALALRAIETSVVFVVLDRSAADPAPAEIMVEYRNTRGADVSLKNAFRWQPPDGIEALAFTVPS
ncbi:hypothetical protein ACK8GE_07020 [Micromonosporaceae bacterium DT194]|uniref:hypothetical protein n=1 Tax=Melissospora conviva TaxID=3388432 RepID=UPI003C276ABD